MYSNDKCMYHTEVVLSSNQDPEIVLDYSGMQNPRDPETSLG